MQRVLQTAVLHKNDLSGGKNHFIRRKSHVSYFYETIA